MLKFNQYIIESNKGFQYEIDIYNDMKSQNLTPPTFSPAGGGHGPDGMFMFRGIPYNFEIKLDQAADYGQIELRHKNGYWDFGGRNEEGKELLRGLGVLEFVEKTWGKAGVPRKESVPSKEFDQEDMKYDYKNFKDGFMEVPLSIFFDHYARKNTYYIQVGKYGFYHMKEDIAKLGTPQFRPKLKLRIRIKRRSSKKLNMYGFLTALKIDKKSPKSKFDLDKDMEFLKR